MFSTFCGGKRKRLFLSSRFVYLRRDNYIISVGAPV